ncbi:MAG: Rpn family recombination-promoting nuclease/putative transposase [Candidatus Riflebacteria bacterium]|nr:Rpn family recombination-promoting nuclease/putative transposase [Candidatus Riflebacteria bacterium]
MPDHDHPYKLLFSHPEMVRDLLLTVVKEDWVQELDFATLERSWASFVSDDLREREGDLVWSVRWGPRRLYVYLLIEFQSRSDHLMAVRLMTYLGLLYQDLVRTGMVAEGGSLPAVLPLVLYNGKPRWTAPVELRDLIEEVPGGLDRYRPSLRYLLIDELRWAESEVASARSAVAALFRLERSRDPAEVRAVLHELVGWLRAPEQAGLRRDFSAWFTRTFLPGRAPGHTFPEFTDLQEVDAMLSETVLEWTKQWKEEGRQEGHREGREEEQRLVAKRLLGRAMSATEVAEVTGMPVSTVEALRRGEG